MPRPKKLYETRRLNLELIAPVRERLEKLQYDSQADTLAEVVRRSLAAYEVLLEARKAGGKVLIRTQEGEKEVIILP